MCLYLYNAKKREVRSMGFEVGKQITSVEIQKADFKQADGIKKLKDNEFEAIWNRFDTNNDGKLDQNEQVGLMAFIQNMAGEDGKITRKEVKNARNTAENKDADQTNESSVLQQFGDGVEISYKDMKRLAKGFQEFVQNQPKGMSDVTKTGDNTFEIVKANDKTVYTMDGQGRIAKRANEKAGTTTYTYNDNNDVHTAETTKNAGKAEQVVTTNTYIYPKDKKDTPPTELQQKIVEGNDPAKQKITEQNFNILEKDGQLKYDKTKARVTTGTGESQKVVEITFKDGQKTQQTTTDKNGTEIINYQQVTRNGNNVDIPLTRTYTSKETPPTVTDEKYQRGQAAGNIASRTITKGGKKVRTTTYNPGGATVTEFDEAENPKEKKVTKYAKFDNKTGKIEPQDDSNKVEEVITQGDKRITNKYKNGKISNITTQFTDSKSPIKSAEQDIAGKTIRYTTKDGKTITVKTNDNGDPTTFPRFKGTRMETAEEIADRLGLQGEAKKAFITANRGKIKPGVAVSVPKNHAINANFKAENVETDGAAEAKKLKEYKAEQYRKFVNNNIAHAKEYGANLAKNQGLRQTWASGPYQVYCKPTYAKKVGDKTVSSGADASKVTGNYQQHYIYNPQTGKMSAIENQIKGLKQGEHVKLITSNGYAKVVNDAGQERLIKLNFNSSLTATVDNKAVKTSDYNKNFKENYIASKGELKDADGNAIKNAEGKAIKTNLYEGRIVDGKVQSVMTHKEGIDLEAANRKALENADKMAKAKGYAKTDTPYLYSYNKNYLDENDEKHTLVYYAYFNKNTNNFVDLGYKSIERARELFAEATKEPDTKHTTTQKQTNPDAEPGTVVDEKIADGQTPPAEETKTLTQAQVNNLAKKNGLTADTKHAGVYYKAQGHGVKTYYVYNTKSEKFEKTTVKTDETAVADNTRVASKTDEELPLPSYAAITSEALRKYNLIDTEKQEIEETMKKYNLKLIASSNLDSPSVIDSKGYKYNYNNMTHEFVPEGWLNDGNKANIIPVGDSQIDVDKPTDWDSMVGLYKSPYET